MTPLQLEERHVEGLANIAKVLKLPRGADLRRVRRWIRTAGLPAFRVRNRGPYLADRLELQAWWRAVQTSVGDGC